MNNVFNMVTRLQPPHKSAGPSLVCSLTSVAQSRSDTAPARPGIRVLLVDDHPVVRQGIGSCLANEKRISIIGHAVDGRDALRKAKELLPDIVLMDIDMPHMSGLTAADILRRENPGI